MISAHWKDVDPWSQQVVLESGVSLLAVDNRPDAIPLQRLKQEEIRKLFPLPDRLFHRQEDASRELFRRSEGWPAAVAAVLGDWSRQGLAQPTRVQLDRLAAQRVYPLLPEAETLSTSEAELLEVTRLCWPETSLTCLGKVLGWKSWELQPLLLALQQRSLVTFEEGSWKTQAQAAPLGSHRVRELHAAVAGALPSGHPERFWHLLWVGKPEEVAAEALNRATQLEAEGRLGPAAAILAEALRLSPGHEELRRRLICCYLDSELPEALTEAMAVAMGDPEAEATVRAAKLAPPPGTPMPTWPGFWLRVATSRIKAILKEPLPVEEQLLEELKRELPATAEAQARCEGWEARILFRKGDYKNAAEGHQRAAAGRVGVGRIAGLLNAARAWMEAGRLEEAELCGRQMLSLSRACRHVSMEAQAEWVLRSCHNRKGGRQVDLELVEAVAGLDQGLFFGTVALTEAWIAQRGGHPEALELATRAEVAFLRAGQAGPAQHARATRAALGDRVEGPWDLSLCPSPETRLDVLALLDCGGIRLPTDRESLQRLVPEALRGCKAGRWSPNELAGS